MDDSHFWLQTNITQKNTGLYPPPPLEVGAPQSKTTNPLVKGDHPGWHWMYSRVQQLIICVWSLQKKLEALVQKPTGNKLADSSAKCASSSCPYSSRVQLTILCFVSPPELPSKPEPQNLPILALGSVSFSVLLMSLSVVATFALFPFVWCSLAS
jgi:hypothetical protein